MRAVVSSRECFVIQNGSAPVKTVTIVGCQPGLEDIGFVVAVTRTLWLYGSFIPMHVAWAQLNLASVTLFDDWLFIGN